MARILDGSDLVADTLRHWSRTCFEWGLSDCALSLFTYLAACGSPGPLTRWQRRYTDEAEAEAIIARAGGAFSCFSAEMAAAGLERTRDPVRGDVGVARGPDGQMICCIHLGNGWWAARAPQGFAAWRPYRPLAWSVPCLNT